MPILQLIILALVQGVTEFLPVSSSAHLILVPMAVPDWSDQGPLIDVAVHVGSLGAVMLYFRAETLKIAGGAIDVVRLRETENRQKFLFIAAATIPIIIVAPVVYFAGIVDSLRNPLVIGIASIGFGLLLWIADRRPEPNTGDDSFTWKTVMFIGGAQALAIIPGTSRSGITITAARFFGIARPDAARFSMLLSIPTIAAFGIFAALELAASDGHIYLGNAGLAASLSFLSAYGAIHVFMKMTERMNFTPFVMYRCVLGIALIAVALM